MKKTAKESAVSKPAMSQGETLGRGRLTSPFFFAVTFVFAYYISKYYRAQ